MPRRNAVRQVRLAVRMLVCLAATGQAQSSWRDRMGTLVRDTVLANGLTVIVASQRTVPLATVDVVIRTGAVSQEPGEEGAAHVFEHLLFRAYGNDQRFARDVGALNGTYNGTTSDELVNYWITAPSGGTERAIGILSRLLVSPRFRDSDLSAEKRVVLNEFQRNASDPAHALGQELGRRLWGSDWPRKEPLGTPPSIESLKLDRLRAIYARDYVPGNAAIVVSGDVDAAEVFRWAAASFGEWAPGTGQAPSRAIASVDSARAAQVFAVGSANQRLVTVAIQWIGPGLRDAADDTHAADVFSELVGSPLSPAADRLLGTGLVQSLDVTYESRGRRGAIELRAVLLPGAAEQAIPALRQEIARFDSDEYLADSLVAIARADRAVSSEYWLERGSQLAHSLAFWWGVAGLDYFRAYVDALQGVGPDDLRRYLRRYVVGKPYVAGVLASPADTAKVARLMRASFGAEVTP